MIESSECSSNTHSNRVQEPSGASKNENGDGSQNNGSNEINELKKKIQELEAQLKEKDAKYLYLYAEFENFKKRSIKERSDLIKFGWEPVARELLQNLDNLELALAHIPPSTDKTFTEGLRLILNQLKSSLQKQGVQEIESLQKEFDPHLHEAVGQEDSSQPAGTVIKEHSRGYTLHGRLLRPARVVVSGGSSTESKSS